MVLNSWECQFFPRFGSNITITSVLWLWKDFLYSTQKRPLLLKWKEEAHRTSQMNILSVGENTLPTSLNFSKEKVQMEHKFSRTSNSSGRRDQLIVGIRQDRLGFAALTNNPHKNLSALKSVHVWETLIGCRLSMWRLSVSFHDQALPQLPQWGQCGDRVMPWHFKYFSQGTTHISSLMAKQPCGHFQLQGSGKYKPPPDPCIWKGRRTGY